MSPAILAVGGPGPQITPAWDFWLPAYVVLSLVLVLAFVTSRVRVWTWVAAFAGGTVWAWVDNALGAIPAAAIAVLVAMCAGAVRSRIVFGRLR